MQKFIHSVQYAVAGLREAFSKGRNFRIQSVIGIAAFLAGLCLRIPLCHWLVLLLCAGLVLTLEVINTAIEALCDHLHPEKHCKIRVVKDLSAGAVLLAAILAMICGALIFLPPIFLWIQKQYIS